MINKKVANDIRNEVREHLEERAMKMIITKALEEKVDPLACYFITMATICTFVQMGDLILVKRDRKEEDS